MKADLFIYPFILGIIILFVTLFIRFLIWIFSLSKIDKIRLWHFLKSKKIFEAIYESFIEGLIHKSIYKKNPILGYMHMSFAFGWFMLIIVGHIEAIIARKSLTIPFYLPIFFRYFETTKNFTASWLFGFLMDLILLYILSGLFLAIIKRFYSKIFGMKKTTKLKIYDKVALFSLWLIFPLRLLAESSSAALYHNGSFLTNAVGNLLKNSLDVDQYHSSFWWAYSIDLFMFFVALPFSRYMHIPTEILFIFLRKSGIKTKKYWNSYSAIQVYSCSRCGICLNDCQLMEAGLKNIQSVYLLQYIRNKQEAERELFSCMLCGQCQNECPVKINLNDLRTALRIKASEQFNFSYSYIKLDKSSRADVVYFAGCMTHLSPGIISAMKKIFSYTGLNVWFMDEEKAPCCGRPLMLAGQHEAAQELIKNNTRLIINSGASLLVVSCPICYKVFNEDYSLYNIKVMFHAQFILELIKNGILPVKRNSLKVVYHDPCELGRGSNIYDEPRKRSSLYSQLIASKNEKENALCCGGSLASLNIPQNIRNIVTDNALTTYLKNNPDILVTACPSCKKTFMRRRKGVIMDIAEFVVKSINNKEYKTFEIDKNIEIKNEVIF